ncbi:hypothetical protein [Piscinibacter terrae]|uniref:hypothetical protein n=1 Tax=Piscinibacter terrae TaxID=2496871 RepID=UPI000F5A8119|nr:hypothetical protein [Albitalea terrae]
MSFLDDLKRQAEALKAQKDGDAASIARNLALTESACKTVFTYFTTLAPQLEVLRPPSHARYTLDRQNVLERLPLTEFRVDSRRKKLGNEDVFDFLVMHWQLKTGREFQLTKDFLPDMEKLEAKLHQSGMKFENEAVRHAENGKLQCRRYTFVADFVGLVRVTAQHESAKLHFQVQNVDGFETVTLELPALEVSGARLDELAKWLTGHPHAFFKDALNVRRVEA